MLDKVNVGEKFGLFQAHWEPHIIGEVNGTHIKIARFLGEFEWHHHDLEDEMFLVLDGEIEIALADGVVSLSRGEMIVVPRGVDHKPAASREALVMLVEPDTTVNTGNIKSEKTTEARRI